MLIFALAPVPVALTLYPCYKAYPVLQQDKVTNLPVTSLAYVKKKKVVLAFKITAAIT